jgi:hypothetical protein
MQDVPTDTKQRMPSSQVLEEVIHQAPAEYVWPSFGSLPNTFRA